MHPDGLHVHVIQHTGILRVYDLPIFPPCKAKGKCLPPHSGGITFYSFTECLIKSSTSVISLPPRPPRSPAY
jgi:hypothetical protein